MPRVPTTVMPFALTLFLLLTRSAPAENWPCWRGPRGDGSSTETGLVTTWNVPAGENLLWKSPVPGRGHASPVVWGDRVFAVSCREDDEARLLLAYDRLSGKLLWEQKVLVSKRERKHRLNSFASSTPATDGQQVYVSFLDGGQMLVAAYDFDGKKRWEVRPGDFRSVHGYCSSVVLFENLVLVNGDHDGDAYLLALDRENGRTVWKTPRENKTRSYCTPIIRQIDGRTQMILSGSKCVASYDPRNGQRHWIIDGPTEQFVASPVYNGSLLFITAGFPEKHILGIRPDGRGNITDTHIVWRTTQACSYVPSPLLSADGRYFLVVTDEGIASCFQASDGQRHWMERLGKHFSASPVLVAGDAYFTGDDGVTTRIEPGPKFAKKGENRLGEPCYASPAVSQSVWYFRGETNLYAIGKKP